MDDVFEKGYPSYEAVNRVEVIGPDGREYVRYFEDSEQIHHVLQDDERTLKIFIEKDEV